MNFQSPVFTEKTQCQDCYKCIRECPVKAIRVENGHAMVVSDLCVLCGHCVEACPAGAKRVRDDLARAKQLLRLKDRVIVSLAPSFASEFAHISPARLVSAMRKLGFYGVSETAVGADLVSRRIAGDFAEAARESGQRLFLSSACPAAVEYVKRYMRRYAPFITDRASPLLAHARFLRETYGEDIGIVFVGPCIAKKREADVWQTIDCAIGFGDLRRWLEDEGLDPAKEAEDPADDLGFIPFRAAKGALYPVDGGMIASVKKYPGAEAAFMMSVAGLDQINKALSGLDPESLAEPLFIEMLSCPGGCVNGPQTTRPAPTSLRRISLLGYAMGAADTLEAREPSLRDTLPVAVADNLPHSPEEIGLALRQVGKYSGEDELNCGSCGYDTCRGFAAAMLDRRAERTMCVSYMRKLAQKKANGLIKTMPSGVVICDSSLRIIECNQNFANLMGEETAMMFEAKPGMEGADLERITGLSRFFRDVLSEDGPDAVEHELREGKKIFHATVFSLERGESACGVIQDVTAPQIQRDRVIKQTQRVIDKNLAVVQKIAFLLGENAAETEATLNSIMESFMESEEER